MHKVFKNFRFYIFLFLLFVSCGGSRTLEDYREEGEKLTALLIYELKSIHKEEDLVRSRSKLKVFFEKIADLMIEAQNCLDENPEKDFLVLNHKNYLLSDQLQKELERVCHFDKGKEVIDECQKTALHRLFVIHERKDSHEQYLVRKER